MPIFENIMALFQNAVLKKYLPDLDKENLQLKWQVFKSHFLRSNTLQDLHALSFSNFLKEHTKQKIKLTLSEQTEWMQYFDQEKAKANAIQKTIAETDKK